MKKISGKCRNRGPAELYLQKLHLVVNFSRVENMSFLLTAASCGTSIPWHRKSCSINAELTEECSLQPWAKVPDRLCRNHMEVLSAQKTLPLVFLCVSVSVPCCWCSVTQLCLALCESVDCSTPGFSVLPHFLELAQTHVYWVDDAIQPSHPLSSPSPPAFNLSQHQGLFQWVDSLHQVAKVLELQLQDQSFQWTLRLISFRIDPSSEMVPEHPIWNQPPCYVSTTWS